MKEIGRAVSRPPGRGARNPVEEEGTTVSVAKPTTGSARGTIVHSVGPDQVVVRRSLRVLPIWRWRLSVFGISAMSDGAR